MKTLRAYDFSEGAGTATADDQDVLDVTLGYTQSLGRKTTMLLRNQQSRAIDTGNSSSDDDTDILQ